MKRSLLLALLLALAAARAEARPAEAEPAEAPPAQTGVLTKAPEIVAPAEPAYPEAAKAEGIQGEVTLELEISETGEVTDAVVTGPAGHGFDEAALEAARRLRFSPAEIDGAPAPVRIEYRFRFTLEAAPPPAPDEAAPPPVNLRGVVVERGTRVPIAGALVSAGGRNVATDDEGRFELAGLPEGAVKVAVLGAGHERFEAEERIVPGQVTEVRYHLRRTLGAGEYEAVVVGEREREVAHVAISRGEIQRIPGVSGDAVKVIQNLPGVARAPGGFGLLVVRGGNPRDTRVYIDGLEVPLTFHFGGLTSVYSSDLVEAVEFEAGNFGVRNGRAIAGRVNLVTRDPGERTHLVADANLYHATVLAEGRSESGVGYAFAARRSYADAVISTALENVEDGPNVSVAPRYYDFQAKLAWKPSERDRLRFDAYGSDDAMVLTSIETEGLRDLDVIRYGTAFYQLASSWDRRWDSTRRSRLQLGLGYTDVDAKVSDLFSQRIRFWNATLRGEVDQDLGQKVTLAAGVDAALQPGSRVDVLAPSLPPAGQVPPPNPEPNRYSDTLGSSDLGVFLEATWRPLDGLTVVPGVRVDRRQTLSTLTWVDPRLAVRLALGPKTTLKGAVGVYHQPIPEVYLTEQWGNPELTEEGSVQYALGAEHRIADRVFLDVQLYYKRLFDLVLPSTRVLERDGTSVPERFASEGTGAAYGAEVLLRWDPDGRFFGWLAYSLSRSKRDQIVAGGESFDAQGADFDQPHNLVATGTVELPELWNGLSGGFRLRWSSGIPYEPIQDAVYDADSDTYEPVFTGRATGRLPAFLQLDLRVDKKWTFRTWIFTAYLEVQNLTNRKNAEADLYNYDYTERGLVTGLPFFPSFGLRAEY
jgi:TonB family protein